MVRELCTCSHDAKGLLHWCLNREDFGTKKQQPESIRLSLHFRRHLGPIGQEMREALVSLDARNRIAMCLDSVFTCVLWLHCDAVALVCQEYIINHNPFNYIDRFSRSRFSMQYFEYPVFQGVTTDSPRFIFSLLPPFHSAIRWELPLITVQRNMCERYARKKKNLLFADTLRN